MSAGAQVILKSAKLSNYRLFKGGEESLRVAFHEKLTVFIGENGAGKTSLLEGLLPLLEVLIARILPKGEIETTELASERDINNAAISFANILQAELTTSSDGKDWVSQWQDLQARYQGAALDEEGASPGLPLQWYFSLDRDLETDIDSDNEFTFEVMRTVFGWVGNYIKENNLSNRNAIKHQTELPVIVYYACEKADDWMTLTDKKNKRHRSTEYDAYEDALTKRSFNFQRFFSWFKGQENLVRQDPDHKHLDFVKEAIYRMLNDDETEGKFYDLHTNYVNLPEEGELEIRKRGELPPIKVSQMSSGEKSLFALVSDLVRRMCILNPHSPNPLESSGIVLIDEIDLHLHPRWQRKVLPRLQEIFPNVQFVATTHSPMVLQNMDPSRSCAYVLKSNATVQRLQYFAGWDIRDLLYKHYGVKARPNKVQEEIDEMLVLIEQGDSDTLEKARLILKDLKEKLGTEDPAIIDAQNSLELLAEIL
jgi:predicted ATP-binding protein involved in virulence